MLTIKYSHTGSNQYLQEPVKLDNVIDNGNGYLESESDYSIQIGAGVHHVNVKGSIRLSHEEINHASLHAYIRKNNITVSNLYEDADYLNTYNAITIFRDCLDVEEGDKIQLYFACDNETGTITGKNDYPITQLSVQVID